MWLKLLSAAFTWISLALIAAPASGESVRRLKLESFIPVDIRVPGLERAMPVDPSIVEANAQPDREILTLNGKGINRETVVYVWTHSEILTYIVSVIPAPPLPAAQPSGLGLVPLGRGSLYRFTINWGIRNTPEGTKQLPFRIGSAGSTPLGSDRLSVHSTTQLPGETGPQESTLSATLRYDSEKFEASLGDESIEMAPYLLFPFRLRGLTVESRTGPGKFQLFGGARATSQLTFLPRDTNRSPPFLAGAHLTWPATSALTFTSTVGTAGPEPIWDIATQYHLAPWTLGLEAAMAAGEHGASANLRYDTRRWSTSQRMTFRTGSSSLFRGSPGLRTDHMFRVQPARSLTLVAGLGLLPPVGRDGWDGAWRLGGTWSPTGSTSLGLSLDGALDGKITTISGTLHKYSERLGTLNLFLSASTTGTVTELFQLERPLKRKPLIRAFVKQSLRQTNTRGTISFETGVEAKVGWLRAHLAPGFIIPTAVDPDGPAGTLRLRLIATPHPAFQPQIELRRTFGSRPETVAQFGIGLAFGAGVPLPDVTSWFVRYTVSGHVFVDQNGNGLMDPGEKGLSRLRVNLDKVRSTMTDAQGYYEFTGTKQGPHTVALDRTALPGSFRLASASSVDLNLPEDKGNISFAFVGSGTIQGIVFNDLSLGGQFTGIEPGIPADIAVEGPSTRQRLSVSGPFSLSGLAQGRYRLTLDPASLPPFHVSRAPQPIEVEVKAGSVITVPFPILALRAIQIVACLGTSPGNKCTAGDTLIAGLTVRAGPVKSTTDRQGRALLRNLPAGPTVLEVDPSTVPLGWLLPPPKPMDLPHTPTTTELFIRLSPEGSATKR